MNVYLNFYTYLYVNYLESFFLFLGNMFSTVRGHVFEWAFLLDEEATHQQLDPEAILNFVPFEESSYATDPIIRGLENQVSPMLFTPASVVGPP